MNNATLATLLAFLIAAQAGEVDQKVLNAAEIIQKEPKKASSDHVKLVNEYLNSKEGDATKCNDFANNFTSLSESVAKNFSGACLGHILDNLPKNAKLAEVMSRVHKDHWTANFERIIKIITERKTDPKAGTALGDLLNRKEEPHPCSKLTDTQMADLMKETKLGKVFSPECVSNLGHLESVKVQKKEEGAPGQGRLRSQSVQGLAPQPGQGNNNDQNDNPNPNDDGPPQDPPSPDSQDPKWAQYTDTMDANAFSIVCGKLNDEIVGHMTENQVKNYCTKPEDKELKDSDVGEGINWTKLRHKAVKGLRSGILVNYTLKQNGAKHSATDLLGKLGDDIFSALDDRKYADFSKNLDPSMWTWFSNPQLQHYVNAAVSENGKDWDNCAHIPPNVFYHALSENKFRSHNLILNGECIAKLKDETLTAYFKGVKDVPADAFKELESTRMGLIKCEKGEATGMAAFVKCSAAAKAGKWEAAVAGIPASDDSVCSTIKHEDKLPDSFFEKTSEDCLEKIEIDQSLDGIFKPDNETRVHPRLAGNIYTWDKIKAHIDTMDEDKRSLTSVPLEAWENLVSARKFCSKVPAEEWPKMPEEYFLQVGPRCTVAIQGKDKIAVDRWVKLPADRWTDLDVTTLKGLEAVVPKLDATRWGRLSANVAGAKAFGAAVTAAEVSTVGKDSKTSGGYITPAHIEQANANILNQLPNAVYRAFSADHIKALQPDAIVGLTKEQLTGAALQHCSAAQIAKIGANHAKTDKDPIVLFKDLSLSGEAKEAYRQRGAANGMAASIGLITAAAAIVAWIAL